YTNTGYKNEISAFTKATYTLQRFTFFGDVQYRYASFEYKGQVFMETIQWHFINPKAGLSVVLKPNTTAYYSIGQAGREPTRNDMFGGNDDLIADSLGNAMLSVRAAEYVLNQELGIRRRTGKTVLSMNAYYMDFKNEIVLNGQYGPNGLALTNHVAKSFRTGLELSANYTVNKHITLINHSSLNYSRIKEQSEIFSPILTPPLIINQEAIYSYKAFSISVSARYQGKSFIDFANTSIINEYFLLNSRIQYDLHAFQFSVFVNNITNSKYFSNGYVGADGTDKYFVQSLTNAYISVKYSFR
ncbi:MAG: TonB-dependent receptor, partial [Cytophagales bacterium]|nr:TonB-dependent receptor [Cytophaga sp.]